MKINEETINEIIPIQDELKRRCAMTKRKRGLFKKAIELSSLCNVDIFVCVFDRNRQKIFELSSD
jgi:histidinol phosphatase-like enzyme